MNLQIGDAAAEAWLILHIDQTSDLLGYSYHSYFIVIKDFDQDNWVDIVIACYDTDHVEILIIISF